MRNVMLAAAVLAASVAAPSPAAAQPIGVGSTNCFGAVSAGTLWGFPYAYIAPTGPERCLVLICVYTSYGSISTYCALNVLDPRAPDGFGYGVLAYAPRFTGYAGMAVCMSTSRGLVTFDRWGQVTARGECRV